MDNRNKHAPSHQIAKSLFKESCMLFLYCVQRRLVSERIRLAAVLLLLIPMCDGAAARMARGADIVAKNGKIKTAGKNRYRVRSRTDASQWYDVKGTASGWSCSCPDYRHRAAYCKHIYAVRLSLNDKTVGAEVGGARRDGIPKAANAKSGPVAIQPVGDTPRNCIYCGLTDIIKKGIRKVLYTKSGRVQQYGCKSCKRRFVFRPGFERMRHEPEIITEVLNQHNAGLSHRKTAEYTRRMGSGVHPTTTYRWNKKYAGMAGPYLDSLPIRTGDRWHGDEVFVAIKNQLMYLFNVIDGDSRFCLSYEMANRKDGHNAEQLLIGASERASKIPKEFVSDGLPSYGDAAERVFVVAIRDPLRLKCRHVNEIRLDSKKNNNVEERFNGTIREREKVLRGVKKPDSATIAGLIIHYNFIRPHMSLGGRTPAEAAGVSIAGRDKWMTIIGNASLYNRATSRSMAKT